MKSRQVAAKSSSKENPPGFPNEASLAALRAFIALDVDCAEICQLAAAAMSRGSEHAKAICTTCADICQSCGDECTKHEMDHCQQCAKACHGCAQECRKMAAMA